MEHHTQFVPYDTGRIVMRSPCTVGREAFSRLEGGERFCSKCQKVVHDLTNLNESEVKALFQSNGGRLCGTIWVPKPKRTPEPAISHPFRRPGYLRNLAAMASFLLLYQVPQVQAGGTPSITCSVGHPLLAKQPCLDDEPVNTWVSGLIVNEEGNQVRWDIPVSIFINGKLHARVIARDGLFAYDLGNGFDPETWVEIVVERNHTSRKEFAFRRDVGDYGAARLRVRLVEAQNLELKVACEVTQLHIDGGLEWEDLPGIKIDENDPLKVVDDD